MDNDIKVELGVLVVFEVAADAVVFVDEAKELGDAWGCVVEGLSVAWVGDVTGCINAAAGEDENAAWV